MEKIHVCIAFNECYAPHASALIVSIMENKNEDDQLVFHILADRLSILTQKQVTSLYQCSDCEFCIIEMSDELFKHLPAWYGAHTAYLRLLIGSVLPQNLSKILYLDSDMIVTRSLAQLYNTDITDKYAAVVAEGMGGTLYSSSFHIRGTFFNAGMILFNLAQCRSENLEAVMLSRCSQFHEQIKFADQDVLNSVFHGNVVFMPLNWNTILFTPKMFKRYFNMLKKYGAEYCYTKEEIDSSVQQPFIIHFASKKKPWMFGCRHPFRNLYWKYLKRTPFYSAVRIRYYWHIATKIISIINPKTYLNRIKNHYKRLKREKTDKLSNS
ncbi:MAG: glycosyltransferase family 8 protein [Planctomycetaceae bacterium]|jgi:lipopolysaccharide biosynthesis glycosyltransferase|nr:glycosyltransferase family 8 protein [Planctomycetaceae bacterium]